MMKNIVLKAVTECWSGEYDSSVTVALSGGADSMALLNAFVSLKDQLGISVYAAHLNHMIRGAEADRDEAFVRKQCEELGVTLFCERADVPAFSKQSGKSLELAAREIRYEFLERVGKGLIATAHNADDNLETVLFNLTRGTGLEGLCGIPSKRGRFIRPLLTVSRAEIEEFCHSFGIESVTDSTNLCDDYTRNKLRHKVIPILKEINPSVVETVKRTTDNLKEISEEIAIKTQQYIKESTLPDGSLSLEGFKDFPASQGKNILKTYIEANAKINLEKVHIEAVYRKALNGGKTELLKGYCFKVSKNKCQLFKTDENNEFKTQISVLSAEDLKKSNKINNLLLNSLLDCDKIVGQYCLRTRLPGDSIRLAGKGYTKTLNKLFNEAAVPVHKRDKLPVLADSDGVIWVCGFGVADRCAADDNTENFMIIEVREGEV